MKTKEDYLTDETKRYLPTSAAKGILKFETPMQALAFLLKFIALSPLKYKRNN